MSARIDVTNNALIWLGCAPITSLEDEGKEALVMKMNYYIARDATLEAHDWSFAMERWIPAQDAVAPEWGAAYRYQIPSDILRVVSVERQSGAFVSSGGSNNRTMGRSQQADFTVESGYILTNESSILCKGIRSIEDEGIFSNLFCHAFSAKLAMICAYALTESNVKFNAMSALYKVTMDEAKSRDGLQGSPKRIRNRSLDNVR